MYNYAYACYICKYVVTELAVEFINVFLDSDQSVEVHSGTSSGHESNASDGEYTC